VPRQPKDVGGARGGVSLNITQPNDAERDREGERHMVY